LIFESAPASFQFPNSKLTGTQVTTFVKKTSDLTHLSISDYRGTESGYKLTAIANPIPDKDNNGEELKGSNIFWDSSLMTSPVWTIGSAFEFVNSSNVYFDSLNLSSNSIPLEILIAAANTNRGLLLVQQNLKQTLLA